jgi:predicted dienelactone hydrolase
VRIVSLLVLFLTPPAALAARDFTAGGPWAVGTTTITYTKNSETTGQPRALATRFWYPIGRSGGKSEQPQKDAPVLRKRWPLVIFSHGSCGTPDQSPFFTAGLASWGFVVAAPPHPGNTTFELGVCNEPQAFNDSFLNRVADVRFVIDQILAAGAGSPFARRINPRRIGMSGHSFGGQTTLRVLAAEPRVRAGVALAPTAMNIGDLRIERPTMVIAGAIDSITPFDVDARGAYALLEGPRFLVQIANTGHCAFAGACFALFCGKGCDPTNLSPEEARSATLRWAVPFFLRYVGHRAVGASLRPASATSPVQVLEAHPHK